MASSLKGEILTFRRTIRRYYKEAGRSFAWRSEISPYRVLVSEIMLQQTQTHRVAPKFDAFIAAFPDFATLAAAPFREVLAQWKGLGYNRRALNLQTIAAKVVNEHQGKLPEDPSILVGFPGIGPATAASICTFAFNQPRVFIETNIRTVFIHFFFPKASGVSDKELLPLVEASLDTKDPRSWYYALMDYGVMLKKTVGNLSRQSKHYSKQSAFEGSNRQLRGMVLQALLDTPSLSRQQLAQQLGQTQERIDPLVDQLQREGFLNLQGTLQLSSTRQQHG